MEQAAHSIVMIRPSNFGSNPETLSSNAFQNEEDETDVSTGAQTEFDTMVQQLQEAGVAVHVFEDRLNLILPDAVFPNNWFSTHHDGTVVLYPMMAESRRNERRDDVISFLQDKFEVNNVLSLVNNELRERCLEGTGSVVFDHPGQIAYACSSPRTHANIFAELCDKLGYSPSNFRAVDLNGKAIYHTNVMMHIGTDIAVICSDSIDHTLERTIVLKNLEKDHEIIPVSIQQMHQFAGNMLELQGGPGENITVMSQTALKALSDRQLHTIETYTRIVAPHIPLIEKYGGGSVRCMMADIHLPLKEAKIDC